MSNRWILPLLLVAAGAYAPAHAQNCASGIPQGGNPSCIPPNVPGSPYYVAPQPERTGRWVKTWGAVTADVAMGLIGVTKGKPTKELAEQVATLHCLESGGAKCEILFTFRNQCAALVWPTSGGRIAKATASTPEAASQSALETCETAGGKGCQVFVSECSDSVYQPY